MAPALLLLKLCLQTETESGILACSVQSHCVDEAFFLQYGKSNFPDADPGIRYMKMKGRKVYEYAIKNVPLAMKACLKNAVCR
jgi:3-oxoacyl-[acyl-carrier-protein] synthase-3